MAKIVQLKNKKENAYPVAIKQIENENGTALLFADGTMLCKRVIVTTIDCTTPIWTNFYNGVDNTRYSFAKEFIAPPSVNLSFRSYGAKAYLVGVNGAMSITNSYFAGYNIFRPTSETQISVVIDVLAIGRWK